MVNLKERFSKIYDVVQVGQSPACGSAPGRIEILGNHTDYNDGFVLSAAVQMKCHVVADLLPVTGKDFPVRVYSVSFPESGILMANLKDILSSTFDSLKIFQRTPPCEDAGASKGNDGEHFSLEPAEPKQASYLRYIFGVLQMIDGHLRKNGTDLEQLLRKRAAGDENGSGVVESPSLSLSVESEVPVGAAVSSSAALEVATAQAIFRMIGYQVDVTSEQRISPLELILLCKKAENEYVGMGCGILDQFSSVMGAQDSIISLDCRFPIDELQRIKFPGMSFVLADTGVKHALVDGEYDRLKKWCYTARDLLKRKLQKKSAHQFQLRDVTIDQFNEFSSFVLENSDHATLNRAKHIVEENDRVLKAKTVLLEGGRQGQNADVECILAEFGRLMSASHVSSRDLFQNSCVELDEMVAFAQGLPSCYGARLMGGGFGGCTINLVTKGQEQSFMQDLSQLWFEKCGKKPNLVQVFAGDGASSRVL